MRKILVSLIIGAICILSACSNNDKNIEVNDVVLESKAPVETMVNTEIPTITDITETPTITDNIIPTYEPMPTPEPTPYKSEKYPLSLPSLRRKGESMYDEEKKLNSDPEKFKVVVDITNQAVFIYEKDEDGEYNNLVREMICSSGMEKTNESPRGTFKMGTDYKRFGRFVNFGCYGQYWSQIRGRIYFHSITYSQRDDRYLNEEDFYMLGKKASHGCIRLLPEDAHWVYLYICTGTTVVITDKLEYDESLREKLLNISMPEPISYEYADN